MARPREFDVEDAVKKAMDVFWKHGYASASLPDLLKGMGIARGSFYKAFGSKKNLFLLALDRYDKTVVGPAIDKLKNGSDSGFNRVASVFQGGLQRVLDGDRAGCLLCNAAAENGEADPEIADKVEGQLSRLTEGFVTALQDDPGWAGAEHKSRMAQANSLTMSYVGLRILSKGGNAEILKQSVERALSMLRRGP